MIEGISAVTLGTHEMPRAVLSGLCDAIERVSNDREPRRSRRLRGSKSRSTSKT